METSKPEWVCKGYPHRESWLDCNQCVDGFKVYLSKERTRIRDEYGKEGSEFGGGFEDGAGSIG